MEGSIAAALFVASVLTSTADPRALAQEGNVIWVGSTGGLVRVEDANTRIFGTREGLPDATVRALLMTEHGLWVGTDRGLARIEEDRVAQTVRTTAPVTAIALDAGRLVVGTLNGVLGVEGDRATPIAGAPRNITDVLVHEGRLYVSTQGSGVQMRNGEGWTRIAGDSLAWDLDSDGTTLRVATSSGPAVVRNDRLRRIRTRLPITDVRAIRQQGSSLVIGTCGAGAFTLRHQRLESIEGTSGCVRAIDATPSSITIASDTGVVRDGAALSMPEGLPDSDISSLARNHEGLWVGTFRAGVARVASDGSITHFNERGGLLDDRINRLAIDGEGDLWIATDRGLIEREQGGRFVVRGLLDRHVVLVAWTGDRIVAATGDDLHAWDPATSSLTPLAMGRRAQDIAHDTNMLAVATAEGLVLEEAGTRRTITSGHGSIPDDWVTAVTMHDGALAIGTYNAGLSIMDGHRVHELDDGLWVNAGALVSATIADRSILAVGTLDDGLYVFDGDRCTRLGVRDGLPDDDVTAILPDGEGGLWLATRGGIALLAATRP